MEKLRRPMHTFSLSSKDSELHGGPGGGISAFEQEPLDASGWFDGSVWKRVRAEEAHKIFEST